MSDVPAEAPTGRVTLVFTDVEGSTVLWERDPETMRVALDLHNALMRRELAVAGGYEVKTEGDAFMVAFRRPREALEWCLATQRGLVAASWPPSLLSHPEAAEQRARDGSLLSRGLRVRAGIHVGEPDARPDPVTGRMDYFGPMVNLSARVGGAAHGGQVLVSGEVHAEVEGALGALGASARDLGEHGLKGITRPTRLVEVLPGDLAARRFPPVRTLDVRRTNLFAERTSFVGRRRELAEVTARVSGGARLVTLLGPGGMGKTRLARQLAAQLLPEFGAQGGVWFCDLAADLRVEEMLATLGGVLGVPLLQGSEAVPAATRLGQAIAGRGRLLLVLDNLEQLGPPGAREVGRLLDAAPSLAVLATSRATLELAEEEVFELSPLAMDEALELFEVRAAASRRGWTVERAGREAVVEVLEHLDAIPLGIELAAARVAMFSPAKLLEKLKGSLDVLSRKGGGSPRQATLRATIDWSWQLLDPVARRALTACAVFRGGFDLEAAEAVLGPGLGDAGAEVWELLESLQRRSLVRSVDTEDGEVRFGLYESVRQYLDERLAGSAERRELELRHAGFYLERAAGWEERRDGLRVRDRHRQRDQDRENLLAVHRRLLAEDVEGAARAVLALAPVLQRRGPAALLRALVESVLDGPVEPLEPALRARLLHLRSLYEAWRGEVPAAEASLVAAMEAAALAGDLRTEIEVLKTRGLNAALFCRPEETVASFQRARSLCDELGDDGTTAELEQWLGFEAFLREDYAAQIEHVERGLRHARRAGDEELESILLRWEAEALLNLDRADAAGAKLRAASDGADTLRDEAHRTHCLRLEAVMHLREGRVPEAREALRAALVRARMLQDFGQACILGRHLATCDLLEGDVDSARDGLAAALDEYGGTGFWMLEVPLRLWSALAEAHAGSEAGVRRALEGAAAQVPEGATQWPARLLRSLTGLPDALPPGRRATLEAALGELRAAPGSVDIRLALDLLDRQGDRAGP